jgi:hypothetical protein
VCRERIAVVIAYAPVIVAFLLGMGVFGFMRQRDKDPVLSGVAATVLSMTVAIVLFIVALKTGNLS